VDEADLLRQIKRFSGRASGSVRISIGDDAAVLRLPPGSDLVATTDMLVENVDYRRHWASAEEVGWKAHAAALSDLAAMGARPMGSMLSLAVSPSWNPARILDVARGAARCGRRYGSALIGGDLSATQGSMVCSLTCLGSVPHHAALTRNGARPGHLLAVTGKIGFPWVVLGKLLERNKAKPAGSRVPRRLIQKYFRPIPRLEAGSHLARLRLVSSAIDISDGLAMDLHRLCEASRVGAEILADRLPLATEIRKESKKRGQDPVVNALASGEEYELLLTLPAKNVDAARLVCRRARADLKVIGKVLSLSKGLSLVRDGKRSPLKPRGFSHKF